MNSNIIRSHAPCVRCVVKRNKQVKGEINDKYTVSVNRALYQDGVQFACCESCLRFLELGPYRKPIAHVGSSYDDW